MELRNRKNRVVEIPFDDEKVIVELAASVKYGALRGLMKGDDEEKIVAFICEYVKKWNITDDGKEVPITPEGLDTVDADVLAEIARAISENPTKPQSKS